jgi:hypothetical protein
MRFTAALIHSKVTTTISISLVLFLLGLVVFFYLFYNQIKVGKKENF